MGHLMRPVRTFFVYLRFESGAERGWESSWLWAQAVNSAGVLFCLVSFYE